MNARNGKGATPLLIAAEQNTDARVVRVLLDAGADTAVTTDDGWNALHFAARWNENPGVSGLLLEAGLDCDLPTGGGGVTPLMLAAGNDGPMSSACFSRPGRP